MSTPAELIHLPYAAWRALPDYPEPEPPWPGWAFSICHHGQVYRECGDCRAAAEAHAERRAAWTELVTILWAVSWILGREDSARW